jgi:hypothetical protein
VVQSPLRGLDLVRAATIEDVSVCWHTAQPFPHLVVDDVLEPEALAELMTVVDEEPVLPYEGDIFAFEASAPEPRTPELRALRDELAATLAPVLARITGRTVSRADLRAFAYREGHYLLPHSDHRSELERALAYVY